MLMEESFHLFPTSRGFAWSNDLYHRVLEGFLDLCKCPML